MEIILRQRGITTLLLRLAQGVLSNREADLNVTV